MSTPESRVVTRAAELRVAFDRGFAAPPPPTAPPHLDLLAIRCAEHGFALPLADVLAVYTERKIVAVPSPIPELLGLVGVRGLVAPVYDLRSLLGYGGGAAPRWFALVRAPEPFAVGFELFEQHLRVPLADVIVATADAAGPHPFARGSVRLATGPRPLLDLTVLFAAVTGRRKGALEREDP
jgi:chemotaxis signal transduction protein